MSRLTGKVAIVTGASRGIGRGVSLALAREGAKVVISSRSAASVQRVLQEIESAGGVALACECDVSEREQIRSMVARTVSTFGTVDILVNNAQGFGTRQRPLGTMTHAPLEVYPEDEWKYTMTTGPDATLCAMQAVFPYMKIGGGSVINLGSRRGQVGAPGTVAYNAAKEAIRAITRTAAREWGKYGITVNVINPLMESGSTAAQKRDYPEIYARTIGEVPLGRFGDPVKDAGGLAVYLASDGRYITGQTITIDGGRHIAA